MFTEKLARRREAPVNIVDEEKLGPRSTFPENTGKPFAYDFDTSDLAIYATRYNIPGRYGT